MTIKFTVRGIPIPKGSTKAFAYKDRQGNARAAVTADNTKTKPWQQTVAAVAQQFAPAPLWTGAVEIYAVFEMPRPKSLPQRVVFHLKRPDTDKLMRSLKDALQGVFYQDDSQVIRIIAEKRYSATPGVTVHLTHTNIL